MPHLTRVSCASAKLDRPDALFDATVEVAALEAMSHLNQGAPGVAVVCDVAVGIDRQLNPRGGDIGRNGLPDEFTPIEQTLQSEGLQARIVPIDPIGDSIRADAEFPVVDDS